jgi:hypothetical protein
MTTLMFLGMSCCLPISYLEERKAATGGGNDSAHETNAREPLLHPNGDDNEV